MRTTTVLLATALTALAALACDADPMDTESNRPAYAKGGPAGETDPTATWLVPLDTTGLALQSDGAFGGNGYSSYASGVCGVTAKIFATTAASNSGDATLNMDAPKGKNGCDRKITLRYPDGQTETLRSFANLRKLQNTTSRIAIGETVLRTLGISPGALSNNPSRCGRLVFGPNGSVALGTDSVQVTRIDEQTWHVDTRPGLSQAWCENRNELYEMPLSFVIVASYPLP